MNSPITMRVMVLVCGAAPVATAAIYNVQINVTNYGRENQNNVGAPPGGGGANSCVPTSIVNGFAYLQSRFAGYNNMLVPGTLVETGSNLAYNYLNTNSNTGTSGNDWIDGKRDYMESVAPGVTTYAAMYNGYTGRNNFVQGAAPTWQFMWNWLNRGAAIEIGILPNAAGTGHALSLTSLHWNDANDDGIIQQAENAQIDVIDPAAPDNLTLLGIWQNGAGGVINVNYGGGYTLALAVSQIPAPGTAVLVFVGVLAAGRRKR